MRLLYKLAHLYDKARFLAWAAGTAATLITPLLPYAAYALQLGRQKRELAADDPELAGSLTILNPVSYLTGDTGWMRWASWGFLSVSILFLICLLILQSLRWVGDRTQLSGVDEETKATEQANRKAEEETDIDDYGDDEWGEN